MDGEKWRGYDDGDIDLEFDGETIKVHRAIIAQASPVWRAMLTGGAFSESTANTVHFDGDDPQVARLCIALIYSTFAGNDGDDGGADSNNRACSTSIEEIYRLVIDAPGTVDEFVDKYDLRGLRRILARELDLLKEKQRLEREVRSLLKEKQRLEREVRSLNDRLAAALTEFNTKPGEVVDIFEHRPPIGTRVEYRSIAGKVGTVIANDEDMGSEIAVRWDDGGESHNLHCGKKGTWRLKYA